MTKHTLKALTLVLALGAVAPAQAADGNLAIRFTTSLGSAIASQGNAAFQQIRSDVQRDLIRKFEELLPDFTPAGDSDEKAAPAASSETLGEFVDLHEEAVVAVNAQ